MRPNWVFQLTVVIIHYDTVCVKLHESGDSKWELRDIKMLQNGNISTGCSVECFFT